jgi:carbonic anhydrase
MPSSLQNLFDLNRKWSENIRKSNPLFFETLSQQQSPKYLWIGCSDSRVPANDIVGLLPGELFVHRNVANVVVHTDLNCLSVLQYAVDVLKVEHVIVCGHYGCGGVRAALEQQKFGLIDNWLRHIQDIVRKHTVLFGAIRDQNVQVDMLCELNVIEQVENVCLTTVIQDAWNRGQDVEVHGWVYGLNDGIAKDLAISIGRNDETDLTYRRSVQELYRRYVTGDSVE